MTTDEQYIQETLGHIHAVQDWIDKAVDNLEVRSQRHDRSKLEEPERSGFQSLAATLDRGTTKYGSEEYWEAMRQHQPTINLHFSRNDHHPEYWAVADPGDEIAEPFYDKELAANGYAIRRMSLLSLLEMLCDWRAAGDRMKGGADIIHSITVNQERFGFSDELRHILVNTARELEMIV